ncbi:MAG: AMP-binding protein [Gammaproteobacteria bacterium]|nr:AMP-binding protein [Gammaproteobacteria bacterium]
MNTETVFLRFQSIAAQRGDAPFLHVLEETGEIYDIDAGDISYHEMSRRIAHWAERLTAAGYGAGQRVGLLLENRPVYLEVWLALNSIGASIVPINPDLRVAELEYLIEHSEMCLAIALSGRSGEMRQAAANVGLQTPIVSPDNSLPKATVPVVTNAALNSHTECALLYTSGTTGKPKGCILSNEYFLHCGDWYQQAGGHISLQRNSERMITPLPLFHMNALAVSVMAMITTGGCLISLDRFHPDTWWESIRKSGATIAHYLGVMPSMLMGAEASASDQDHSVRFGFGAGVDKKLHAAFETRFGFPLIEAWACTETGSGAVISAHEEPRHIGSSCFGRPCENVDVRLIDDQGVEVGTGEPGELLVRRSGANPRYGFCSGYLKNPEATEALWKGGWLNTGDVVSQDADGSLHFIDRKKNVIRRSGENIAAVEVESVLNRHPDIALCAAAAAPDELRGDEVAVFVVLDKGKGDEEQARAIVSWSLEQMAYFKAPGWIAFVDELPLTATQKILRGELKSLVSQTFERRGFIDTRPMKKRRA